MIGVLDLLDDLLSPKSRPMSPSNRLVESRASVSESPKSPKSPIDGGCWNFAGADPAVEARRARVVAMLSLHPEWRYAVVTDTDADPGLVVVHIGIRDVGSGEVVIAKSRYDGFELMRAIESVQPNRTNTRARGHNATLTTMDRKERT
jgi:hypothetical protein